LDRILIWPRSQLVHFCTANFLKKMYPCELYIAIDDNHVDKEFFENQQFVKFNRIWYFNDYNYRVIKPDISYLKKIESKYGINLWQLIFEDRIFYNFNHYHTFKKDEILSIIQQNCQLIEKILDESKPDFLISEVPAFHTDQILHKMCEKRGIKIMIPFKSRIGYRIVISSQMDRIDENNTLKNTQNFEYKNYADLQKGISKNFHRQEQLIKSLEPSIFIKLKVGLEFLVTNKQKFQENYSGLGKTKSSFIIKELKAILKTKLRSRFIDKNLKRFLDDKQKFVFFPLQVEPERSLLIGATFYTNQLEVIKNLAKSLPIEYKLYVKEHPRMKLNGWREVKYYKEISELPNVQLFHPSVLNDTLIKNSSLVVTATGTSAMEAAFFGKPSIVLGDTIYSDKLDSIYRIKSFEEIPEAIRNQLNKKISIKNVSNFLQFMLSNSLDIDQQNLEIGTQKRFQSEGFTSQANIDIESMDEFLKLNENSLKRLAAEFVKKMELHKSTNQ